LSPSGRFSIARRTTPDDATTHTHTSFKHGVHIIIIIIIIMYTSWRNFPLL